MTLTAIKHVGLVDHLLSETEARAVTNQIKGALIVAYDLVVEAWRGRADLALGYMSWDAYCAGEFADARMVRLPREQRQEIVATMRDAGMSTRAISQATAWPQSTIADDVTRLTETGQSDHVATITSLDGRERPAQRPMSAAQINAITPPEMVAEAKAESERALPAFDIRMAIDDLLAKAHNPETVVRDCPDHARGQFDRVPEALAFLTALNQAMETYR